MPNSRAFVCLSFYTFLSKTVSCPHALNKCFSKLLCCSSAESQGLGSSPLTVPHITYMLMTSKSIFCTQAFLYLLDSYFPLELSQKSACFLRLATKYPTSFPMPLPSWESKTSCVPSRDVSLASNKHFLLFENVKAQHICYFSTVLPVMEALFLVQLEM